MIEKQDEQLFEELLEEYLPEQAQEGEIVEGEILRKDREYVYLDIKGKILEGMVKAEEVEKYDLGDIIEVIILGESKDESYFRVSRKIVEYNKNIIKLEEAYKNEEILEGNIVRGVSNGFIVNISDINTFLPKSLSEIYNDDEEFEGKNVKVIVKNIKGNKKKKILVSVKDVSLKEEMEELEKINIDDMLEVEIKDILDFGLIVTLDKVKGFIHISELSWKKISNIKDLFSIGEKLKAKVIFIDKSKKSLKLSIKRLKEDPWIRVDEKYPSGTEVEGKVSKIMKFGAFVELEEGIEGLVYISDLTWSKRRIDVNDYVKIGDKVIVKIMEIDKESKKIKLGIKQLSSNPWDSVNEKYNIGSVVKGKVSDTKNFGIFINFEEGIDAFIHNSDLSWSKGKLKDEYKIGDEVEVKILEISQENQKMKAGIKQLVKSPWELFKECYKEGDIVTKPIKNITDFGIFLEFEGDINGLIHVSQISNTFIKKLDEKYKIGENVTAKILNIDEDKQRVRLSSKVLEDERAEEEERELVKKYNVVGEEEENLIKNIMEESNIESNKTEK